WKPGLQQFTGLEVVHEDILRYPAQSENHRNASYFCVAYPSHFGAVGKPFRTGRFVRPGGCRCNSWHRQRHLERGDSGRQSDAHQRRYGNQPVDDQQFHGRIHFRSGQNWYLLPGGRIPGLSTGGPSSRDRQRAAARGSGRCAHPWRDDANRLGHWRSAAAAKRRRCGGTGDRGTRYKRPAVKRAEFHFSGAIGSFAANGLRPAQNNYLLDGIDDNANLVDFLNGAAYVVKPPVDAIAEFKMQTDNYSAEAGRSAGAILNATIKSGTNEFHGNVWEFLRNDALDAANFFENSGGVPKGEYRQNQFGFTI